MQIGFCISKPEGDGSTFRSRLDHCISVSTARMSGKALARSSCLNCAWHRQCSTYGYEEAMFAEHRCSAYSDWRNGKPDERLIPLPEALYAAPCPMFANDDPMRYANDDNYKP